MKQNNARGNSKRALNKFFMRTSNERKSNKHDAWVE